jgi:hypothetical protein
MPDRAITRNTVLSSTAVAAATNSAAALVERDTEALVMLSVTAVSGTTPTLSPVVQSSSDDGTTWFTLSGGSTWVEHDGTTVTQFTSTTGDGDGTGRYVCAVTNIGKHIRVRIPAPGGSDTPTWTLSVVVQSKN